jgi:hypothetical protein
LHEIPQIMTSPDYPIDAALLSVSPPDKHGWCSLGPSVVSAAVDVARLVIAEVNPRVPRTLGNSIVHDSHLDSVIETDRRLPQFPLGDPTAEHRGARARRRVPEGGAGRHPRRDAALSEEPQEPGRLHGDGGQRAVGHRSTHTTTMSLLPLVPTAWTTWS